MMIFHSQAKEEITLTDLFRSANMGSDLLRAGGSEPTGLWVRHSTTAGDLPKDLPSDVIV